MTTAVAAIDLGATSGRVVVGHVGPGELRIREIARFPNGPVALPGGLHWNIQGLYRAALDGLRDAAAWEQNIASLGVDSWAVDYALLRDGRSLGEPFHYRDGRGPAVVDRVHERVTFEDLYARNGLQFLPFTTIYQLAAEDPALLSTADELLLIPDLIGYWLTGRAVAERTNASTTGLLDVASREWDRSLLTALGMDARLLPGLIDAGDVLGPLLEAPAQYTGLARTEVIAVGTHDTASAVVAAPMRETGGAYISCGTWGLVGIETERPVLSNAARHANFTNEGGVDGRTRFLHNVMGLWLLSESIRMWERGGTAVDLERLLAEAAALDTTDVPVFDANDPIFLAPGDMPSRIAEWCVAHGLQAPRTRAQCARSIIESLARAFADAVATASKLAGQRVDTIHMVGGGAMNALLCQRTADIAGLPVLAGPVEATALGNVLVQGRALGAIGGTLESMRDLVRRTFSPRTFEPAGE